ncbi:MAG TPA: acetylglutamate kinase [Polyangia bacterium]|jgi:acetylglutamate kinase
MTAPIVVKLGGDVLDGPALASAAVDLAGVRAAGRRLLVVHGGGPQATALSERLGLVPNVIGGRRVTDSPTLDVMKMVVAGKLNVDLVAALRGAGVAAVGLAGTSGVVRAVKRPPRVVAGGGATPVDFGWVGDVIGFDEALLALLHGGGYTPVIASMGLAEGGGCLNINADVVASQLAAALGAAALVAVTSVGGVRRDKDDPATRLARLTVAEARAAIAAGAVRGGMIPKLEEAFAPLAAGVAAVHIVAPGEVRAALEAPGSVGTVLVS